MRLLYHWPLDPDSRQARIALAEKNLKFKTEIVDPWAPTPAFARLCVESVPPCLVDPNPSGDAIITGARAICEYAHEEGKRAPLLSQNRLERAEARRLCEWFNRKFSQEVNAYILHERIEKVLHTTEPPSPPVLREGREHLQAHLAYMDDLLSTRDYLAGPDFSLADITAGAHLSCLDFVGEINWKHQTHVRDWYQKFKSRPSVRPLLKDRLAGFVPPPHYANLDF